MTDKTVPIVVVLVLGLWFAWDHALNLLLSLFGYGLAIMIYELSATFAFAVIALAVLALWSVGKWIVGLFMDS